MSTPTLRERLKVVQELSFKAIEHPLMPADARSCIAEIVLLQVDLVRAVETLKAQAHEPFDFTDLVKRVDQLWDERNDDG